MCQSGPGSDLIRSSIVLLNLIIFVIVTHEPPPVQIESFIEICVDFDGLYSNFHTITFVR